jgi:hypothetical protein
MDFCRVISPGSEGTDDVVEVIFSTHQAGPDDGSPLRMISEERLAQLLAIEAAHTAIVAIVHSLDRAPALPQQPADG